MWPFAVLIYKSMPLPISTWAEEALVTAVFCIIICGAFGTLAIIYFYHLLLDKARFCPCYCC